jgi:hypothetical protein
MTVPCSAAASGAVLIGTRASARHTLYQLRASTAIVVELRFSDVHRCHDVLVAAGFRDLPSPGPRLFMNGTDRIVVERRKEALAAWLLACEETKAADDPAFHQLLGDSAVSSVQSTAHSRPGAQPVQLLTSQMRGLQRECSRLREQMASLERKLATTEGEAHQLSSQLQERLKEEESARSLLADEIFALRTKLSDEVAALRSCVQEGMHAAPGREGANLKERIESSWRWLQESLTYEVGDTVVIHGLQSDLRGRNVEGALGVVTEGFRDGRYTVNVRDKEKPWDDKQSVSLLIKPEHMHKHSGTLPAVTPDQDGRAMRNQDLLRTTPSTGGESRTRPAWRIQRLSAGQRGYASARW